MLVFLDLIVDLAVKRVECLIDTREENSIIMECESCRILCFPINFNCSRD